MRICFIGNAGHMNLLSWVKHWHGVLGNTIHVVSFSPPVEHIPGVEVHLLPYGGMKKLRYLLAVPRLTELLRSMDFDLLAAYRMNSYGFMAAATGFRPLVLVAQGSDIFHGSSSFAKKQLLKYVIGRADMIHCFADHMSRMLVQYGANPDSILVLPKGIDTGVFRSRQAGRPDAGLQLVTTRQLRKTYRHELILSAIPAMLKVIPDLGYLVIGDGEYRAALMEIARKLGIEKVVTFAGRLEHAVLASHLSASHIYVSMQPSDGVSASLLEAMACGVFPIVVDNEANRLWIKDGENGFLVPAEDSSAFAKKVVLAFKDPALREKARKINEAFVVENMSIGVNIRKAATCYSRLIGREKGRGGGTNRSGPGLGKCSAATSSVPGQGGYSDERT